MVAITGSGSTRWWSGWCTIAESMAGRSGVMLIPLVLRG
jgi:hypothetical protein